MDSRIRKPTFKMTRSPQRESLFRSKEERDTQVRQYEKQDKQLAQQQRNLERQLEAVKAYRVEVAVRIRNLKNLDLFEEDTE